MKNGLFVIIMTLGLSVLSAQTKVDSKFGNGLYNAIAVDSSWSMKIGLRFQTLFVGTTFFKDGEVTKSKSDFLIRRARLKFNGFAYSPKLQYKFEIGLSNRDIAGLTVENGVSPRIILDAVLKYNFYKNFTVWIGQTKLPGNRERVISSGDLQFVNRSLLNSAYNIDRDIGIQLRHHFILGDRFLIREIFAISQGEGRNITIGNLGGYDYTARVEFLPMGAFTKKGDYKGSDHQREQNKKLSIGVTYDMHDRSVREAGNRGIFMTNDVGYFETDINTLFVDLMYKYKGISVMAEYANKQSDNSFARNSDNTLTGDNVITGTGLNVQTGYLFKSDWEVALRYTAIDPAKERNIDITEQYTIGGSRYLNGHKLKVQADLSYTTIKSESSNLLYRIQFDLHF